MTIFLNKSGQTVKKYKYSPAHIIANVRVTFHSPGIYLFAQFETTVKRLR